MNKGLITLSVTVFSAIGSYIPVLFGDGSFFDGWSILGGLVGGILGIWLAVFVSRRWG